MNLVLLPHHNTLTCLQKLQQTAKEACPVFLPSYPQVCVLSRLPAPSGNTATNQDCHEFIQKMDALKVLLSGAEGVCSFGSPSVVPAAERSFQLELPLEVPFSEKLHEAGFVPESSMHFVLGRWEYTAGQDTGSTAETLSAVLQTAVPPDFRAFRLALMQTTPLLCNDTLSEAQQPSAFTWKFIRPFWVKLC